jgi:hypothetical protein
MARDSSGLRCSRIELVARRQEDLSQGYPDFHVYAGNKSVGRIYQTHFDSTSAGWFWGVKALTVDLSVGSAMHGSATLADAKTKLRAAFDRWIEWAEAMPRDDLKYPRIAAELKTMVG